MTRAVRPPWVVILIAVVPAVCVGAAFVMAAVDPSPDVIVMVGPVQADEIRIVLFGAAAVSCCLGVGVAVTRTAMGWRHPVLEVLGALAVAVVWLTSIPFVTVVILLANLYLDDQPDVHRFDVDGRSYLVATRPQYDPSVVSIDLFQGTGRRFVRVDRSWPPDAPAGVGRGEFTVVRRGDRAWIVFGQTRLPVT
jgi:hypothetical protein